MDRPSPITPLGTVWLAMHQATFGSGRFSASARQVYDAQRADHPLDQDEVVHILVDLWESDQIDLDVGPSGELLFRFNDPARGC